MVSLPIGEPQPNYSSQGPIACKFILVDPGKSIWIVKGDAAPVNGTSGDGAGWCGPGSLYILSTGGLYQNTNTQASPTWTVFESSSATPGAATESEPTAPTAPASTSAYKMQGLAGAITPSKSGIIQVTIRGNLIGSTTTAGDGILLKGSYGTGAAPANAGTLAGTQKGAVLEYTNPATVTAADINVPFSLTYLITGAALGTALWLDLAAESAGTASSVGLTNVDITAIEVG